MVVPGSEVPWNGIRLWFGYAPKLKSAFESEIRGLIPIKPTSPQDGKQQQPFFFLKTVWPCFLTRSVLMQNR